jgi:hypothetical protein
MLLFAIVLSLLAVRSLSDLNVAYVSYCNDFINPSYILGKNWSATIVVAQQSIVQWADWLAAQGSWCTHIPPLQQNHHLLTLEDSHLEMLQLSRLPSLFLRPPTILTTISVGHDSTSATTFTDAGCSLRIYQAIGQTALVCATLRN